MTVELLHHSPLWACSQAIRTCWDSHDRSDSVTSFKDPTLNRTGDADKALIDRVGNKNKHKSTLEHLVYTFEIKGVSRALLQELARHRMASYSVKSTRYTLKELRNEDVRDIDTWWKNYCVETENTDVNHAIAKALFELKLLVDKGASNDVIKYALPEAYKTELVMTINARSLQNFIDLRSNKAALWEIQTLARNMYNALPVDHQYIFNEFVHQKEQ